MSKQRGYIDYLRPELEKDCLIYGQSNNIVHILASQVLLIIIGCFDRAQTKYAEDAAKAQPDTQT